MRRQRERAADAGGAERSRSRAERSRAGNRAPQREGGEEWTDPEDGELGVSDAVFSLGLFLTLCSHPSGCMIAAKTVS
ncbi:hypothetical protein SRHO_G00025970 [Serrasalmus rhombeus]